VTTYEVQVTSFNSGVTTTKLKTNILGEVSAVVDSVPSEGGVVFVAALAPGVDLGNFYLFRNEAGLAHVVLHEHREHFARDPQANTLGGELTFRGEDGEAFSVPTAATIPWPRAREALLHWLPSQARSPELQWD
jgi:hypothetical protein